MAEYGTAVATAVVGKITENLFDRILKLIWSRITRVFKLKANIMNLKEKVGKLKNERERVLQFIDAADKRGEEVGLNVETWLARADKFSGEMEKLGDDEDKAKKKCFAGVCPNYKARYQISKKAEEDLEAIAQLLEEAAKFKIPDSHCAPPRKTYAPPVKGFVDFGSRNSALSGIMEALRSATVQKIGLYGMPGVGKTMLAKEVARQATQAQLFDEIVMVTVKRDPELKGIQGEIADKLGVQLHKETESGRADQLKEYIKKKKRILVILDDIWKRLDLDELGIPFEDKKNGASSIGEERMQCKILLTSRFLNVLSSDMHTDKDFQLGPLQDEEPWELFKKIVGDEIEKPDLRVTALKIAEECAGLPLAVEALGNALKGRSPHVWRFALLELQRPSPDNFTGLSASVYSAIELSYNHLEREELQHTFLLCSLLGRNASVEDLIKVGVGLDLFRNVKTIEEARDRVQTWVSDLKSCSLLHDAHSNIHFDMHDIVHDVTVSIASRDHHFKSFKDDNVPNWEELRSFKWISLENVDIGELPDRLECPQLTLFFLSSDDPSKKVPENLFLGTQKLRVLGFANMHLSSLPSSLCLLKNLRTLLINESVLEDVARIGKMVCLEVLSLSGCDIGVLPMEIGQLTRLKILDLSDCTELKVIPPRVLASLSRLEELYLGNSFDQWDVGRENGNQRNASLSELKDLSNLAALDIHVCDVHLIPEGFFSERLERYNIFIGDVGKRWAGSFNSSKVLKLQLNTSIRYDHSIGMLMKKTEELHLEGLKAVNHLVNELDTEGFQELKYFYVQNALEVKHIVNSVEYAFPILEVLLLRNLSSLVKICHGSLGATSFSRLTTITVECCNQLKSLFPFSVVRRLLQLKEIGVTDCSNMAEIVDEEGHGGNSNIAEANQNFELVQLRSLKLHRLPNFIRLWHGSEEINDSSSNLPPLFHEKIVFPNLEELELSSINIKNIWGRQLSVTSSCIRSVTKLIIEGCDHLEHLLSSSITKSLVQLRCLEIKKCERMREIIEPENEEEMGDLISFPKLELLNIQDLENLNRFCSRNCSVEFTSLRGLAINNCPELKGFVINQTSTDIKGGLEPFFNEKVVFPCLEFLTIYGLDNLRIIWPHQPQADSFCKLKSLLIGNCGKLLTIFPSNTLSTSLELLGVYACRSLEVIFEIGELNNKESHVWTKDPKGISTFFKLKSVRVSSCPKLQYIFPVSVALGLQQLEDLWLVDCGIEEIFGIGDLNNEESHVVVSIPLRELNIMNLPRLKNVWTNDPEGTLTFLKLKSVRVMNCPELQYMFPVSVASGLQQLEELLLINCGIEEVVAFGGLDKAVRMFVFPSLSTLHLSSLPKLKYLSMRGRFSGIEQTPGASEQGIIMGNVSMLHSVPT